MRIKPIPFKTLLSAIAGPTFALAALILLCGLTNDVFLSTQNLLNIMRQVSYSGRS